jgi:hypothetical protein
MTVNNTKRKIIEAVQQLPDEASVEDAMERLYFLAKVERGLAEGDSGKTLPHGDTKNRLK